MSSEEIQITGLVLYSRANCHLCDVMLRELRPLLDGLEVKLSIVDISERDDLIGKFGERIPVLTADGVELCHYRLDTQRVQNWLAG